MTEAFAAVDVIAIKRDRGELDDAQIDWLNGAQNYNALIVRATKDAPGRHTFVTEFAASRIVWVDR